MGPRQEQLYTHSGQITSRQTPGCQAGTSAPLKHPKGHLNPREEEPEKQGCPRGPGHLLSDDSLTKAVLPSISPRQRCWSLDHSRCKSTQQCPLHSTLRHDGTGTSHEQPSSFLPRPQEPAKHLSARPVSALPDGDVYRVDLVLRGFSSHRHNSPAWVCLRNNFTSATKENGGCNITL